MKNLKIYFCRQHWCCLYLGNAIRVHPAVTRLKVYRRHWVLYELLNTCGTFLLSFGFWTSLTSEFWRLIGFNRITVFRKNSNLEYYTFINHEMFFIWRIILMLNFSIGTLWNIFFANLMLAITVNLVKAGRIRIALGKKNQYYLNSTKISFNLKFVSMIVSFVFSNNIWFENAIFENMRNWKTKLLIELVFGSIQLTLCDSTRRQPGWRFTAGI